VTVAPAWPPRPPSGGVQSADVATIVVLTQAAYDALAPPDPDTLYIIAG
jgi:hypothetical protein